LEKKRLYERPVLRKVRLVYKSSVLATCNTSTSLQPRDVPVYQGGCGPYDNNCSIPD
jgi:hypothetical protein